MESNSRVSWTIVLLFLAACLVGLLTFTATLAFRNWTQATELETMRLELDAALKKVAHAQAVEKDLRGIRDVANDLYDWRAARLPWAGPLEDVAEELPEGLALSRVNVRGSLGGEFLKADPGLPPRFVPRRDYRVLIEGVGRDAKTSGSVADFSTRLSHSDAGSNVFANVKLQGIVQKKAAGDSVREFSLIAECEAGRPQK